MDTGHLKRTASAILFLSTLSCACEGRNYSATKASGENANSVAGASAEENKSGAATLPEEKTGSAQLTRLGEAEIRARLIGQRIMPDRSVEQPHIAFSEDFLPDGTWATSRAERAVIVARGTWRITGDQICVSIADRPTQCRPVWMHPTSEALAMTDMGSSADTILVLVASPLG